MGIVNIRYGALNLFRHPGSHLGLRSTFGQTITKMDSLVILDSVGPQAPDDGAPTVGQAAVSLSRLVAAWQYGMEVSGCPGSLIDGAASELSNDVTELAVTSSAELDALLTLAAADGDRASAGHSLGNGRCRETGTVVTKLGKQGRGEESASWQ